MFVGDRNDAKLQADPADRLLAEAARAAKSARQRIGAMVDLFLPDSMRLSDYQRITVRRFLARLVTSVENDIRQRLVVEHGQHFSEDLLAALGSTRVTIALPVLERARALHDAELIALLLARVEEQKLTERLRKNAEANGEASSLIEALMADADPALSAAAMALLIAESRRCYIFEDSTLPRTDLPAEMHYRLTWCVAAAIRDYLVRLHGVSPAAADSALTECGSALLAAHDEGEMLEAAAMHLAQLLGERGWLDDQVLKATCVEGRLALLIAILAVRAGMDFDGVREMILPPNGGRLILLLKALGVARDTAAAILLAMNEADDHFAEVMVAFDTVDPARAQDAIRPWQIHPGYRAAIAALSSGTSERGDGWVP